ncbi:MAG: hypothetical protein JSU61_06515 [Fidelibacterota bacterium]|nr:MAG: hypothetical protein JSU61_06515 [Candidatus Neomarinimicrobiota bacterium]
MSKAAAKTGAGPMVTVAIEQRDYLQDICRAVESVHRKGLTLDQAQGVIRLERYNKYLMYDRISRDIEAYWRQLEGGRDQNEN